jgi:hypothetical protein
MFFATRWALVPAVLAGWLCLAAPALAVAPEVKDEAGLFSAEAVKRANETIADIDKRFKKDLAIETFKAVPEGKESELKGQGRERFFARWAEDRMAAMRGDGVYVLICANPTWLEVTVGKETLKKDFLRSDADKLRRDMVAGLKAKKADQALLDGVRFVSDTIQAHRASKGTASAPATPRTSTNPAPNNDGGGGWNWGGLICMGLLILGGIWLVVGLVRAFTGGGGGGGGYGPGGGWGGGGFGSSLLGGLFGAMAGMWLYNNVFGGHSTFGSTAYGSEGGGAAASDEGQAGYSSGESWGDDSGGDAGGGDWGGGDAGGGDWGGGGGDWGGGGGDFGGGGGGDW